jgi:serralysin
VLNGGNGADRLMGQLGHDTMIGGLGNDAFEFNNTPIAANTDIIRDFADVAGNNDIIALDDIAFTTIGGPGPLNPAFFRAGPVALDANDHVIYNQATGVLNYDTNGNAGGGVFQIATLTNRPVLTAADFVVV